MNFCFVLSSQIADGWPNFLIRVCRSMHIWWKKAYLWGFIIYFFLSSSARKGKWSQVKANLRRKKKKKKNEERRTRKRSEFYKFWYFFFLRSHPGASLFQEQDRWPGQLCLVLFSTRQKCIYSYIHIGTFHQNDDDHLPAFFLTDTHNSRFLLSYCKEYARISHAIEMRAHVI